MAPVDEHVLWVDDEAGPVVRHYAIAHGRTRPSRGTFDIVTVVVATRSGSAVDNGTQPEHAEIIRLCQDPVSVAELAARLDRPVGTVRVLLGDLLDRGLIRTRSSGPASALPTERVFKAVLDGLRAI
jgi:hypothetical protein